MNNYGYGYQPMMHYWSVGDVIGHVILAVVLVCIVIWVLRMIFGRRHGMRGMRWYMMQGHMGAMSTLRERYAKGEINTEEYEEKKKVLMQ